MGAQGQECQGAIRRQCRPNKGLELTGNSVRSCVAPAVPSSSGPALGAKGAGTKPQDRENCQNRGHRQGERPSQDRPHGRRGLPARQ